MAHRQSSASLDLGFEMVHTIFDYQDGPRIGIADHDGAPHRYALDFDPEAVEYLNTYSLVRIPDDLFQLAMEDWAIWRRWETSFHHGLTSMETYPALPQDRNRHALLANLLVEKFARLTSEALVVHGQFTRRIDDSWNGIGAHPLQVKWTPVTGL